MAKASTILTSNREAERLRQLQTAAVTLALYRAKQIVKDALRRQGKKVSLVPSCEITQLAKVYLAQHRDRLIPDARATVECWIAEGVFGKRAQRGWLRANLENSVQTQNPQTSMASAVQISGAE